MNKPFLAASVLTAVIAVFVAASPAARAQSIIAVSKPIPLVQATRIGKQYFPAGDTPKGGNGQPVDGIQSAGMEALKAHYHAHLALFYRGEQLAIPQAIGIVAPFHEQNGFVGDGKAFYWLHTHDATGIIHIESPDDRAYTLGNFFDIWGQPLTQNNVAGLAGTLRAFVDGKVFMGNARDIVLKAHQEITLVVGDPVPTPPRYTFPDGV